MSRSARRATEADAAEVARLRQLALTCPEAPWTEPRELLHGPWVGECRDAIATLLRKEDAAAAFVIDGPDGRLASCALGLLQPRLPGPGSSHPFNGDISTVATDYDHRRRGYARIAVTALIDWMTTRGCKRITLHASSEGVPLYTSLGFVIEDPRMGLRVG